jgi:DsbC/DsbD-like thiol-disulfide interchange protein
MIVRAGPESSASGRMISSMLLSLAIAAWGVALTTAQSSVVPAVAKPGTVETPHLTLTTSTSVAGVAPGGRVSLFVAIAPKPGMHVYSPDQKTYIPVSLRLAASRDVAARAPIFPKGEPFYFAPLSETQIVYSRPFRIELPVTVAGGRVAGPLALAGTLEYQACDDRVCYVPRTVPLTWTVAVR